MKRFALAVALACVLSGSVVAGDAHSVGAPSPGDTPIGGAPAPGDMGGGGDQEDDGNQGAGGIALLILDWLF